MTLGAGVTGAQQPCDGALNQHVRRSYGMMEANELMKQMRTGIGLPTTTEEDSLGILHHIWTRDTDLHLQAAQGFKEAGLSIDLNGSEDLEVAKEAREFWWAPLPAELGNYSNMREKINDELAEIERMHANGELPWGRESVESLIEKYPAQSEVDDVLKAQADLAGHYDDYALDDTADNDACEIGNEHMSGSDSESDVESCDICGFHSNTQ